MSTIRRFPQSIVMPRFGNQQPPESPQPADASGGQPPTETPSIEQLLAKYNLPGKDAGKTLRRAFPAYLIAYFADVSGDHNAIHLNKEAAKKAGFEDILAHGAFVNAQFSTAIVELFKGHTPIYGEQNTQFTAPVYAGDTVDSEVSIKSVVYKPGRKPGTGSFIYTLATNAWVVNPQTGERLKQVIKGTAQGVVRVNDPH